MKWSVNQTKGFLSLLVITPLGFACKFYPGPGHGWFNNYGAGLLYEIFWILLAFLFFPLRKSANVIPICVFVITCILEFLQLWHPPFLEAIRSSFLGSALIGTTFVWWDFPHYVLGCLVGWFWLWFLLRRK
ncbi:MAG: DUF2809 domain-containing protein [Thermodesulfobacteriota bacterium]|nr:DUF2809 domain-containing protein [Thermodesulfobacteriota bacterium]